MHLSQEDYFGADKFEVGDKTRTEHAHSKISYLLRKKRYSFNYGAFVLPDNDMNVVWMCRTRTLDWQRGNTSDGRICEKNIWGTCLSC